VSGEVPAREPDADNAPPPLLGSWRRLYRLVLGALALNVLLLYALGWWAT
jgi:hypothetical protein